MEISGRQLRAARGLMGWSMDNLAEKSGLTTVTIRHIESEAVTPQEKTLVRILAVFDRQGVEFQDDEGVRLRKQQIRTYSGKAGYRQLLDHIFETVQDGGRIRQFNFGDLRYLPYADEFVDGHLRRMEKVPRLDARVLELKGSGENRVSYCHYRYLPKSFSDMAPYYLYGDFIVQALFETGVKREFVSIHSKFLAQNYMKEFDLFWKMAGKT